MDGPLDYLYNIRKEPEVPGTIWIDRGRHVSIALGEFISGKKSLLLETLSGKTTLLADPDGLLLNKTADNKLEANIPGVFFQPGTLRISLFSEGAPVLSKLIKAKFSPFQTVDPNSSWITQFQSLPAFPGIIPAGAVVFESAVTPMDTDVHFDISEMHLSSPPSVVIPLAVQKANIEDEDIFVVSVVAISNTAITARLSEAPRSSTTKVRIIVIP